MVMTMSDDMASDSVVVVVVVVVVVMVVVVVVERQCWRWRPAGGSGGLPSLALSWRV